MTLSISTASTGSYEDASEAILERLVTTMSKENEFLILERTEKPDEFAQTSYLRTKQAEIVDGRYVVEYRDGANSHWQASTSDRQQVYEMLAGWAFDRAGWKGGLEWERLDLGF